MQEIFLGRKKVPSRRSPDVLNSLACGYGDTRPSFEQPTPSILIGIADVTARTGYDKSGIYGWIQEQKFPSIQYHGPFRHPQRAGPARHRIPVGSTPQGASLVESIFLSYACWRHNLIESIYTGGFGRSLHSTSAPIATG